jgi:hypothetical protein
MENVQTTYETLDHVLVVFGLGSLNHGMPLVAAYRSQADPHSLAEF